MKKLLLIFTFVSCFAQAQTTLLCEDDFNTSIMACTLACTSNTQPRPYFSRNGSRLVYDQLGSSPSNLFLILATDGSAYDTLRLEMDFDMPAGTFYNNWFTFFLPADRIAFNYLDETSNKAYSGYMEDGGKSAFLDFRPSASTTYNSTTRRLVLKFIKPAITANQLANIVTPSHTFNTASWGQVSPPVNGQYISSPTEDQSLMNSAKQAFCATTGNPSDCQTKVNAQPIVNANIRFTIDNFKAYGIKAVLTGLEEEIKHINTRTLVGIYNSLGQKLDADQTHEGLAIKVYSDGTKEKFVLK